MADKAPEAFRTISEVAELLETPPHVLRFWESKFSQLKPVKRAGGRRYYRPADVALVAGIKRLLHDDGMTIRGVQKLLREQGARHVAGLARALPASPGAEPAAPVARDIDAPAEAPAPPAAVSPADMPPDMPADMPTGSPPEPAAPRIPDPAAAEDTADAIEAAVADLFAGLDVADAESLLPEADGTQDVPASLWAEPEPAAAPGADAYATGVPDDSGQRAATLLRRLDPPVAPMRGTAMRRLAGRMAALHARMSERAAGGLI